MEYMQPSAWAAITEGARHHARRILSASNTVFATFSTNSDDSWIATDKSVVRAKYGTLSTPDPDAGEYQWEGNPAMVSGTLDAATWTAEAPIAPEGWVTRHPAALYNAPNEGLCALYVGESGRTHFGRVPPPPNAGVLAERTPAFFGRVAKRRGASPHLHVHMGRGDGPRRRRFDPYWQEQRRRELAHVQARPVVNP
ncbi:MAG: hypothetical protein R3A51_02135 [Nannocystaceae bacterium]